MKIVVATDSYKGCLSSLEAASCVSFGLSGIYPEADIVNVSMADGGEGLVDALCGPLCAHKVKTVVSDPLGRPVEAEYALTGKTAVIEVAAACGLHHVLHMDGNGVPVDERDPLRASTRGVGELILDAVHRGCRDFIIGLGGSATNDGGRGMMECLRESTESLDTLKFTVACDVDATFIGPRGASRVFAPQKGASPMDVEQLESSLEKYAGEIYAATGVDVRYMPGAGAAGGLGGAFAAWLGAELRSGVDIVLDAVGFDDVIKDADLIITGEGRSDAQTAMGKTVSGVLCRAKSAGVPVVLMSGAIEDCPELGSMGFAQMIAVTPQGMDIEQALMPENARRNIIKACSIKLQALISDMCQNITLP